MSETSPAPLSAQLAAVVAVLAVLAVFGGDPIGIPPAVVGGAVLVAGVLRASRRLVAGGAAVLFLGVLGGALRGDPLLSLLGGALAVVAWDVGEHAIGVGEQLGADSPTRRLEVTHAAASAIVGLAAVGVGYGIYTAAWSGLPETALTLFVAGALLLTWALR